MRTSPHWSTIEDKLCRCVFLQLSLLIWGHWPQIKAKWQQKSWKTCQASENQNLTQNTKFFSESERKLAAVAFYWGAQGSIGSGIILWGDTVERSCWRWMHWYPDTPKHIWGHFNCLPDNSTYIQGPNMFPLTSVQIFVFCGLNSWIQNQNICLASRSPAASVKGEHTSCFCCWFIELLTFWLSNKDEENTGASILLLCVLSHLWWVDKALRCIFSGWIRGANDKILCPIYMSFWKFFSVSAISTDTIKGVVVIGGKTAKPEVWKFDRERETPDLFFCTSDCDDLCS